MVRSSSIALLFALATPFAALGCTNTVPRTEVLVVVDTDLRGPGGIDNLFIEVLGPTGTRQTSTAPLGEFQPPLPRSLALLWETGPLGPFTVHAVGNTGGSQRVERTAVFTFQREQTLVLPMNLLARCERSPCAVGQTCGETGCRSEDIDPSELLPYTGTLPGLDASTPPRDGGVDSGRDSGIDSSLPDMGMPIDMGTDAGVDAAPDIDVGIDAFVPVDACPGVAETCNMLDDDCNGMIDETFDLQTDEMNCGTCGHVCNFANATGACVLGVCEITMCDTGFDDCNTMGDDGCEVDLVNDPMHCGTCATRCGPPDRECCASMCERTCP